MPNIFFQTCVQPTWCNYNFHINFLLRWIDTLDRLSTIYNRDNFSWISCLLSWTLRPLTGVYSCRKDFVTLGQIHVVGFHLQVDTHWSVFMFLRIWHKTLSLCFPESIKNNSCLFSKVMRSNDWNAICFDYSFVRWVCTTPKRFWALYRIALL